ncbi:MAG: Adrm1b protein [Linnemannia elongata]|nr:MAG: Adrm1b protein [Linnemannia elongata]
MSSKTLLQFKAGRCFRDGATNTVKPDATKGLVYMEEEEGLLHFFWKNRATNSVEDDLILFPGDAELLKVDECTTGRVLVLKFKSSSQKLFFWLQESNADRDQIVLQQANTLINQGGDGGSEMTMSTWSKNGILPLLYSLTALAPPSLPPVQNHQPSH